MFYIYHCKSKDNFIAPMDVSHEEQIVFEEGQITLFFKKKHYIAFPSGQNVTNINLFETKKKREVETE